MVSQKLKMFDGDDNHGPLTSDLRPRLKLRIVIVCIMCECDIAEGGKFPVVCLWTISSQVPRQIWLKFSGNVGMRTGSA